jgi:hypothetical protein
VAEDSPPGTDWLTGRTLPYDIAHQDALIYLDAGGRDRFVVVCSPNAAGAPIVGTVIEYPRLRNAFGLVLQVEVANRQVVIVLLRDLKVVVLPLSAGLPPVRLARLSVVH